MFSSQTMTAPAVGHRPPGTGPNTSLYDYGGTKTDSRSRVSPRADPATVRDASTSTPANDTSTLHNTALPSAAMVEIKQEPVDATDSLAAGHQKREVSKQTAASALLAQILGNPDSGQSVPSTRSDEKRPPASDYAAKETVTPSDASNGQGPEEGRKDTAHTGGESPKETSSNVQEPPLDQSQPIKREREPETMPASVANGHAQDAEVGQQALGTAPNVSDPPLLKSNLEDAGFFPPFDVTAAPKTPLEALQQNEMLTAAYLSQSADLSALGYSHGLNHEGAASVAGSEPRIQAFAKLEFDDGHFYVNTYSFTLGRDVRAARAAHQREIQARQAARHTRAKSSSGGNTSHTPNRVKREGSGIMGSVVSDRGGIMGFDPDVPPHLPPQLSRRSSNSSFAEAGPVHATPAQLQSKDYNALAMQSLYEGNGDAKPVDTLALLPSPDACPTIPIHPPATVDGSAAGHRGISRKHVKIAYNFDKNFFEMEVMGRNGAFIGADWLSPGQIRPLHSGDYIQIGGVRIRFLLPDVPIGETGADRVDEPDLENDPNGSAQPEGAEKQNSESYEARRTENDGSPSKTDTPKVTKIVLKSKAQDASKPVPSIESAEGVQQPVKRRGPGRPPKDGIMSKRERAELAREQKLAAKREANGGVTPPAPAKPKSGPTPTEGESPTAKPEKRKYTKRKKPDDSFTDVPMPSTEAGQQIPMDQQAEEYTKAPPVKKRKPSRSPSPNYPPESAYTPEDLAKPPYNYAVLIFDALTEAGTPMTLKQIYRALKLKYPYFRFKCETEGWTSSVRHNLNGNNHLFMHAERDGKGWSWQLRPGASVEKEKKRRPSPPPPSTQPPNAPSASHHYMPPMPHAYPNAQGAPSHSHNQRFQYPPMPTNPYTAPPPMPAPTPRISNPYPPAQAPFSLPSPLRNNLPPAFAQATPSTYTSPYASDPPPQLAQLQQAQQRPSPAPPLPPPPRPPPQHHQSPYAPPPNPAPAPAPAPAPSPAPNFNLQPPSAPPPAPAPPPNQNPQSQPQPHMAVPPLAASSGPNTTLLDHDDPMSFDERANKAIDDFEAVLMEDYEDKNYIRQVLRSARARVLGNATASSFPNGEPKDEAVILDALRNLIEGLKEE